MSNDVLPLSHNDQGTFTHGIALLWLGNEAPPGLEQILRRLLALDA